MDSESDKYDVVNNTNAIVTFKYIFLVSILRFHISLFVMVANCPNLHGQEDHGVRSRPGAPEKAPLTLMHRHLAILPQKFNVGGGVYFVCFAQSTECRTLASTHGFHHCSGLSISWLSLL
jgi:hypothetical protein